MRRVVAVGLCLLLSGCAHMATYRPEYIARELPQIQGTIEGKVLIVTEPVQDTKVYSQHPASMTGVAWVHRVKLGEFLSNITLAVLSRKFKGGAEHAAEMPESSDYRIVVRPEVLNFEYWYSQLRNLGLFITPEARIDLYARLYGEHGQKLWENTYQSKRISGGGYIVSLHPQERINRAVHRALMKVVVQMADDIEAHLRGAERAGVVVSDASSAP